MFVDRFAWWVLGESIKFGTAEVFGVGGNGKCFCVNKGSIASLWLWVSQFVGRSKKPTNYRQPTPYCQELSASGRPEISPF
jgi:hypothetical protein